MVDHRDARDWLPEDRGYRIDLGCFEVAYRLDQLCCLLPGKSGAVKLGFPS
jgi:hypothetical protein